jgi:hypothetical protein
MKKIVQLEEREYNELSEKASYNQNQIEELAKKMYQERGTYQILLTIDCERDYNETIKFTVAKTIRDYEFDCIKRYKLLEEDKRRIIEYVDRKINTLWDRRFGRNLRIINTHTQLVNKVRVWFTIFGCLVVIGLFLVAILK